MYLQLEITDKCFVFSYSLQVFFKLMLTLSKMLYLFIAVWDLLGKKFLRSAVLPLTHLGNMLSLKAKSQLNRVNQN